MYGWSSSRLHRCRVSAIANGQRRWLIDVAELHDVEMGEEAGRRLGMPLNAFTEEAYKELAAGNDQIVIGSVGPAETFNEIIDKRRSAFNTLAKLMRGES